MNPVLDVLSRFYNKTTNYLPNFFYGLLVLLIGILLGGIVKQLFLGIVKFFKLGKILKSTHFGNEKDVNIWVEVLGELLRWVVIILFLIPTVEVWGLSRLVTVLNNLLFYLPNVIVAVIIGLVGYVVANLTYDIVLHSLKTLEGRVSSTMAGMAKYTILIFTGLVVLNQLGVAQSLIQILFTGVVFMISLAGGLAFGLGGQDFAKDMLSDLRKSLKKK